MITKTEFKPTIAILGDGMIAGLCHVHYLGNSVSRMDIEIFLIQGMRLEDIMNIITHESLHWIINMTHSMWEVDDEDSVVYDMMDDHSPRVRLLDDDYE